ncbi:MAG: DUF4249 domain-containing protein [Cyclobacteriaceae bacterium]
MKRINFGKLFFLLPWLLISCLEETSFDLKRGESQLVVEGYISNQPEVYSVRLTTLAELNGITTNTLGANAVVTISELDGPSVQLVETSIAGRYQTIAGQIVGKIGKAYQLDIKLSNGEEYQSSLEVIPAPISIASIEAEFVEKFVEQSNGVNRLVYHDINIEVENTEATHYLKVENSGWAKVEVGYGLCDPPPPWRTQCWQFREPGNAIKLSTNQGFSLSNYMINAVSIPIDFKHEYIAIVQLKAMSSDSYNFWNKLGDQLDRSGGLFDRPFAPVVGNIVSTNDALSALGYFHAYAVTDEIVCYDRADIRVAVSIPRIGCLQQCVEIWGPIATYADVTQILCP